MKNQNQYIDVSKLDKIVEEKYSTSYMNNTKWNKLIQKLTDQLDQIYVNYKLIHSDQVKGNMFITPDFKPFFIEPILYKEIEWIEIPKQYEDWKNENNRKAGKQNFTQNLDGIISEIIKIGQFEMEAEGKSIRIYGYK